MKKETETNVLIRCLQVENIKKLSKQELYDVVFDLNRKKGLSFRQLESLTGISRNTLSKMCNIDKQDSTQETHRMLKNNVDIDVLIRHFQTAPPRTYTKTEIERLIMALHQYMRK